MQLAPKLEPNFVKFQSVLHPFGYENGTFEMHTSSRNVHYRFDEIINIKEIYYGQQFVPQIYQQKTFFR